MIVDGADQLIGEKGLRLGTGVPGCGMFGKAAGDFCPAPGQRLFQCGQYARARLAAIFADGSGDFFRQLAPVNHGALVRYAQRAHAGHLASGAELRNGLLPGIGILRSCGYGSCRLVIML